MQYSVVLAVVVLAVGLCNGDMYLHNPRGSNNRANENTATRKNNNRVFDSQNNARGGYNIGDQGASAAGSESAQYRMKYFQSAPGVQPNSPNGRSELVVEWTNQHGCGGNEDTDPHKLNCNIVLQMLCQEDSATVAPDDGITLRNGQGTNSQAYGKIGSTSLRTAFRNQRNANVNQNRPLQEPWFWYDACNRRQRNKGLFTATQNLAQDTAVSTRQNANGGRSGYECPEERDYFPYWHPTPFIDVAVLSQNESMCEYYKKYSFNRAPKYRCVENFASGGGVKHFSEHNNEAACTGTWTKFEAMLELAPKYTTQSACEGASGNGVEYAWGKPWDPKKIDNHEAITDVCFVRPPEIDCQAAAWSRSNHLGNGREGVPLNYTWTLPYFPSGKRQRCIFRARYNISTDDYDPYNTDQSLNGDKSPVQQNPLVKVGGNDQPLRLAINTAQFGRTFQDRSHVFHLEPRPSDFDSEARIINLNVRGKRGNIVQTFPAVEYDFFPNRFTLRVGKDYLHVQWTGSNTHNNKAPGGDGQTGDAGEGTGGTDRHNFIQTLASDTNFPLPVEAMTMQKNVKVMWYHNTNAKLTQDDIPLVLASGGYYECFKKTSTCSKAVDTITELNNLLNNAPASFPGIVLRFDAGGHFHIICTRNNNFTNRSQKCHLKVEELKERV